MQALPLLALWLLRDARSPDQIITKLVDWHDTLAAVLHAPNGGEAFLLLLSYIGYILSEEQAAQ